MFSTIVFDISKYVGYNVIGTEKPNMLNNLNKINVFIGQNNSGKSRFIRSLFIDDDFEFLLSKADNSRLMAALVDFRLKTSKLFEENYISDADNLIGQLKDLEQKLAFFKKQSTAITISKIRKFAIEFSDKKRFGGYSHVAGVITTRDANQLIPFINHCSRNLLMVIDEIFPPESDFEIHRVYIPILRGLRPTLCIPDDDSWKFIQETDNYKRRTIKDYFFENRNKIDNEIFTGLNLYEDTKKLLLGRKSEREKIKSFEEFLSINFFNNQNISLIPDFKDDVLLIGIGEEERPVYSLGDGIQSIIIMLYPLFFNQDKNLLVFIEEPENSLHPGMQRIFIEALQRKEFEKFQFFITTHSNHFLDITLDFKNISAYSFRKSINETDLEPLIKIENVNNNETNVLDLIGVRNSSIFLSNSTIWVEGITDRLYIRKFLEVYQNELLKSGRISRPYREDLHYSFIEYGGSNITHYSFAEDSYNQIKSNRISNRILLIADSDNADQDPESAKAQRLKKLKRNLGEKFIQVDGKEIENILKENIILKTVAKFESKKLSDLKYDSKTFLQKNYEKECIGRFIKENIKGLKKKYDASSGTISNKVTFCYEAIEHIESVHDLSKPALQMAKKIFEFIQLNNN